MWHALKTDSAARDNVHTEGANLVSLKVYPELSVTDTRIVQEKERQLAVLGEYGFIL